MFDFASTLSARVFGTQLSVHARRKRPFPLSAIMILPLQYLLQTRYLSMYSSVYNAFFPPKVKNEDLAFKTLAVRQLSLFNKCHNCFPIRKDLLKCFNLLKPSLHLPLTEKGFTIQSSASFFYWNLPY